MAQHIFLPPSWKEGPLINPGSTYRDTKDPCPVFDGKLWHIFGSGGSVIQEKWEILHATAQNPKGPWRLEKSSNLGSFYSDRVAAPGVLYDVQESAFHMFVQTDFMSLGGTIEHFISKDGGATFVHADTAISSMKEGAEQGVFDSHPFETSSGKYIIYAGMSEDLQALRWKEGDAQVSARGPDLFTAKSISNSWAGPWERQGLALRQEDVPHSVKPGSPEYEWGLEGPQLFQIPTGEIILNAVCFIPEHQIYQSQRIFFSLAESPSGPFTPLGLAFDEEPSEWECAEWGHAAAIIHDDELLLFYQARAKEVRAEDETEARWRYGVAGWRLDDFCEAVSAARAKNV